MELEIYFHEQVAEPQQNAANIHSPTQQMKSKTIKETPNSEDDSIKHFVRVLKQKIRAGQKGIATP
jgi:hypothetical protein